MKARSAIVFLALTAAVSAEELPRKSKAPRESYPNVDVIYDSVRMPDGKRLRSIITKPRDAKGKLPVIFLAGWLSCDSVEAPVDTKDTTGLILRGLAQIELSPRARKSYPPFTAGRPFGDARAFATLGAGDVLAALKVLAGDTNADHCRTGRLCRRAWLAQRHRALRSMQKRDPRESYRSSLAWDSASFYALPGVRKPRRTGETGLRIATHVHVVDFALALSR